jgi:membrane protein DedA with SNARE-associated domain
LSIIGVIAVAAAASFVGSSVGYWLGQSYGRPLLARYGRRFGLGPPRIRLGEYLFASHGGKIVLLGRFLTVLRAYGGVLAGSYRMSASRFHAYNALGALTWAAVTCFAAYFSGELFPHVHRSVGVAIIVIAGLVILGGALYLRRQEAELQRRADQALIGS